MTMVIKAFFVFTLHLFHVAQSSESDEARKLISIHDLTSGEELNPQRLRFQKIRSEETNARHRGGKCKPGELSVKITKFVEPNNLRRGSFLGLFGDNTPNLSVRWNARIEYGETVQEFEQDLGGDLADKSVCLKVKGQIPSSLQIDISCERKYYPAGNFGRYIFNIEDGKTGTFKLTSSSEDIKKENRGVFHSLFHKASTKAGRLTIEVVEPSVKEEPKPPPEPYFWTCPDYNPDKPFDRIRKDYNELTGPEREIYIQALNTAKRRGWYDLFVAIHKYRTNDKFAHTTMSFYAWHRKFLVEFENMLRSLDERFKCITIPYWDWAQEYKVCASINNQNEKGATNDDALVRGHGSMTSCDSYMDVSHILKDFGGPGSENSIEADQCCSSHSDCDCNQDWCDESAVKTGMFGSFCEADVSNWRDPKRRWGSTPSGCVKSFGHANQCTVETVNLKKPSGQGCVTSGPFKDWKDFEGRDCLVRGNRWDPRGAGAMTGTLALAKVRLDSKTFVEFMTKTYGAIHGSTHVQIGGHMSTMHSPQDPLFFSHHAFIDKLWSVWQDCHDAHDNKEKMFTGGGYGSTVVEKEKNMPYCLSADKTTNSWIADGKHLPWIEKIPALIVAMDDKLKNPDTADNFAKDDDQAWACGSHGNAIRVTSQILPSWTDVFTPEKWSDTYDLPQKKGVLYWPDDMDRHSMKINQEICNFDKWAIFQKTKTLKTTQDAMLEFTGNNRDETTMDESNTRAVEFLEISEQIEKHHANMWTRQQVGAVGDELEIIGLKDADIFTQKLSAAVTEILKAESGNGNIDPKDFTETQDKHVKTEKEKKMKEILKDMAKNECDELGDTAPKNGPLSEPLGMLKAWIGHENMKSIASACIKKPQDCSWIPRCKRLEIEECSSNTSCQNPCKEHTTNKKCSGSPGCVWLEAPAPDGIEVESPSEEAPSDLQSICV